MNNNVDNNFSRGNTNPIFNCSLNANKHRCPGSLSVVLIHWKKKTHYCNQITLFTYSFFKFNVTCTKYTYSYFVTCITLCFSINCTHWLDRKEKKTSKKLALMWKKWKMLSRLQGGYGIYFEFSCTNG